MNKYFSKFISIVLIVFAFSVSYTSVNGQNKKDMKKAQALVKQGDKSLNQKSYQDALNKYAEAISLVDNYPYAHFWKGNAHYYLNQNELALREINIASEQGYTPKLNLIRIRWYLNYQAKNYDAAQSDLNEGLLLEPNNLSFKLGLGDVFYVKQAYREALNVYIAIVEKVPAKGNTYYNMADCYFRLGETENQKLAAEMAVKNGTQNMSDAYFLIGKALQKERKYNEAAEAYERSINVKRDNYDTYRSLSDVYRNLNKFDDAIRITKKALVEFERDGNLYSDIAWYYSLADRHMEAVGAAQIAVSLLPLAYQGHTYLCRGYNDIGEYQKAIAECNEALRLKPDDGETNFYLGRAYAQSGKPEQSSKFYTKAVTGLVEYTQKYPDFADGYYLLGNAYFSTKQNNKAIENYLKSLELSPKFKKARFNLGFVYIQNGDIDSAHAQYNVLLELDKNLAGKLLEVMPKK